MTSFKSSINPAFKDFDKFFVGFEEQLDRFARARDEFAKTSMTYPPYNIRKDSENKYTIELAVAGFVRSEIEITIDGDQLNVKGNSTAGTDPATKYLFKGIGMRSFDRTFQLSDQIEIRGATMLNGILNIFLERVIPEHKKPRKVEIVEEEPSTVSKYDTGTPPSFLTETMG